MGQRAELASDWSDIVATWFLGQPTTIPAEQGWAALGDLERLAPEQIDKLLRLPIAVPMMMSRAIRLGIDLAISEPCSGFDRVHTRVRQGERGAISEIMWGALIIRAGFEIEFEPTVGNKRADTLIRTENDGVYAEVIAPDAADETISKATALQEIAIPLRDAFRGIRLDFHVLTDPREVSHDELVSCLADIIENGRSGSVELSSGVVRWEPYQPQATWSTPVAPSTDLARFGAAGFHLGEADACVINVTADISDSRIESKVKMEGRHLSRDEINLLVIDMTSVLGSRGQWDSLLRRRFQPNLNRRFGAGVMLQEDFKLHELNLVISVIENPFALRDLPARLTQALTPAD